jgi:hypothetical protein
VGILRGSDGFDPVRAQPVTRLGRADADPRAGTVSTLGTGTLACPDCDAPIFIAGPHRPHDALSCAYCGRGGALHEFLSLATPSRPARVEVRLIFGAPAA